MPEPTHRQVSCVYLGPDRAYATCACGRSIDAGSEYLASYLMHNHITAANYRAKSTAATEALLKETQHAYRDRRGHRPQVQSPTPTS
jgi:hypothetical protein